MDTNDVLAKRIAVLAGGWADEREISLDSARACTKALTQAGFAEVTLLDVAAPDFVQTLASGNFDVAFIAMHGRWGEDGCVQGLCEVLHLPYTFSGVLSSAVANEKDVAKGVYREVGIPVADDLLLEAGSEVAPEEAELIATQLGLPLFVKPAANGSSYGVTRVASVDKLARAVREAASGGQRVLIEACITGTEITVPVIGNEDPQALPIIEIVAGEGAEFYDLKVKYEPSELHHVMPARLDPAVYAQAQEYAVVAHRALGCRGASRSDFIVQADGSLVILETNTIPGMTETSLLPDSARHAGIEFPELCRRFVEMALEEHAEYVAEQGAAATPAGGERA